ncbi:MAG TPA: ABC transporter permease [Longimicrobiales bacterium]|nr:ABC transporter permease [Longimicrobiales bacterium]
MRYAIRSLLKAPGFSFLVVLTLALGIGANTAIFSVFRGVLLRPLPHEGGERIVYLHQSAARAGLEDVKFSVPEIIDLREQARTLTGFAEFSAMPFTMLGAGTPVQVQAGIVSANFFEVMGLSPVLGRALNAGDDGAAADPVMVLTWEYWQRAFGSDPAALGRVFRMNGRSVTVIGVLEPAPPFPGATDVFVNLVTSPHHLDATMVHGRSHRMTDVFARLAPGAPVARAQAEIDDIAAQMYRRHPDNYDAAAGYAVTVTPLRDALVSKARLTLYLLMAAAGLVLLTTCANVANLVLTRNLKRDREFAVRWAMGADRAQLRRILLAETGILAALGAGFGLGLAYVGLDLLVGFAGRFTARASEISMDGGVLLFAVLVASAAALAFAFAPGLRSQELAGAALTRSGTRTTGGRRRLQRGLIVAQVAASVTVLTAAGLLGRTLMLLNAVETGVELENTLTLEAPADHEGRTSEQIVTLQEEMRRRIAELPGVAVAGVGLSVPLRSNQVGLEIRAEGRPPEPGVPVPIAEYRTATPEYFRAAGMKLLAGREFAATDRQGSGGVAILNQALAERLFGSDDPIGRRVAWTGQVLPAIGMQEGNWKTVVGVVGNTRDHGPDEPPPLVMFQPLAQNDLGYYPGAFVIRGSTAPTLAPRVQQIINELAPEQPVLRVATLEQIRTENIAAERLNTFLVGTLGVLALVIAAVGLAGVLSFFISQRTAEIGIRMSLGADPRRVLGMVLGDGAVLLGIGTLLGIIGSLVAARLLEGMLFGVAPRDPATLALVTLVMITVGLGACAVPALRAARVDPLVAIRKE